MANIENNPEKNDEQRSHFAEDQELKAKVYDAIEEQLIKSTEEAFKSEGFKSRMDTAMKKDEKTHWNRGEGEQGWNRGVYGDGSTYGMGTKKGEVNVTVNRVKGPKSTNSFFEKDLSFGGKRMVVEIHVDIDAESETMDMTYKTTEQSFFRGHHDKKGPFMIDEKCFCKLDKMSNFKKELKKKFDGFAEREANYFIKTKLGIEDRTEKSINSMVENNMKKLSLTDILKSDFDETLDKIMESTKKDDKAEKNHPEVIDANTPDNLLFDDKDDDNDEDTVEEVSSVGGAGSVGGFEYDANAFADTPYAKKGKKRTLKRENNDGWTEVELEPGSGYVPKGMNKNYALGLHGAEVNSAEEDRLSKGSPKGRAGMKGKAALGESFDPSKRKFTTLTEHEEKGVNKRYIITHKKSSEEENNRWSKLSNFDKNSTIRIAESCGAPVEDGKGSEVVKNSEKEVISENFMKRNGNVDHGDEVNGKNIIIVPKPNSLTNATFKVFEEDYLNEGKAFILDMHSGNLVNNPNYKAK